MRIAGWVGLVVVDVLLSNAGPTWAAGAELAIGSPAFVENGSIPAANTCDGSSGNPPLVFSGIPPGARSLAVIVEDPDVPWILQSDRTYVHWVVWNLAPDVGGIPEGKASGGINEGGGGGYAAPCPPNGEHRYVFKLFALDATLGSDVSIRTAADLYRAMEGHTLAHAETTGHYRRPFGKLIVLFAILGVPLLSVAGVLYGIYRGVRRVVRNRRGSG
jgi:Raf kinase inhibitor-like YbhB/YbcL family protein